MPQHLNVRVTSTDEYQMTHIVDLRDRHPPTLAPATHELGATGYPTVRISLSNVSSA